MFPRRFHRLRDSRTTPGVNGRFSFVHGPNGQNECAVEAVANVDRFEILNKLALLFVMCGIALLALGILPNCPSNCVAKSCHMSRSSRGRCFCKSSDNAEYCANETLYAIDRTMFHCSIAFFGMSCFAALLKWFLSYWFRDDIPVQTYHISGLPYFAQATVISQATDADESLISETDSVVSDLEQNDSSEDLAALKAALPVIYAVAV